MYEKLLVGCRFWLGVFAVLAVAFAASPVFAQTTGIQLDDSVTNLDLASIGTSLVSTIMTAVMVGAGVGLSVWAVMACIRFFRRSMS